MLKALQEGGYIIIEISDDGAGIEVEQVKRKAVQSGLLRAEQVEGLSEAEALNLIFLPGLTTAETATNLSGRGVGMDVVKTQVEKIGGAIDIATRRGVGTTITIRIPLTLAIIPSVVVTSGGERFAIPQVSLLEFVRLDNTGNVRRIEYINTLPVYRWRGTLLPLVFLNRLLNLPPQTNPAVTHVAITPTEDRQFGLVVDQIGDTQEIVVKPLTRQLRTLTCYAGATIMGDGRVALILDVMGIARNACLFKAGRLPTREQLAEDHQSTKERQMLLLFQAGRYERLALPLSLIARLEEISQAQIEQSGGEHVIQYRGGILPLVLLADCLDANRITHLPQDGAIKVIVVRKGQDGLAGLIVDQIGDIIEEHIVVQHGCRHRGVLGSAIVHGRLTDMLNLSFILESVDSGWVGSGEAGSNADVGIGSSATFVCIA